MAKKSRKKQPTLETAVQPTTRSGGKGTWKLMDRGSSIAAGLLAQRASAIAWRAVTGKTPPVSGRHPDVSTREAIAWAVIGGGMIELVKVGIRRSTATYWVKSTGHLPPGMKPITKGPAVTGPGTTKEPVPTEPAPGRATKKKLSRRSRGR